MLALIKLAGDIEMDPGLWVQCRSAQNYCKATDKFVECEDSNASCANLIEIEWDNEFWYCKNCKADVVYAAALL